MDFSFSPIAFIESPYKEKFAIPRQPGLVPAATGKVIFTGEANNPELVRDIEQYSHLWVIFVFHGTQAHGWKPLVRPPRLGGNEKTGVLSTRSTFRPNAIGMSVVKLDEVVWQNGQLSLSISGLDLLDNTPVLDIKPYVPYSDALPDSVGGMAQAAPDTELSVEFDTAAEAVLQKHVKTFPRLKALITQVLKQDPRPAYKKSKLDEKVYGMKLYDFNIMWRLISANTIAVTEIQYLS